MDKNVWFRKPEGRKLRLIHAWNAWLVLALAVSGVLLYLPEVRLLGGWRVVLKQVHIVLGVFSVAVLLLYLPRIRRHVRSLSGKRTRQGNLAVVLALLIGWGLSGIVLWQFRKLPTSWSNAALVWHDVLTWVGLPYALYHSVSRSRWLKRLDAAATPTPVPIRTSAARAAAELDPPLLSRRNLLRIGLAAGLALVLGPVYYRWMKGLVVSDGGSVTELTEKDGNRMLPAPVPAADSAAPIGGGAKGQFRIYTVTDLPVFTSDTWQFKVGGLVEKPMTFDWDSFLKIPRRVQVSDFHCVTGWSVRSCTWEGIRLSDLLKTVRPNEQARFVKFYSGDGEYTDALSLDQANMDDVMVAVMLDGKQIPQKLGGPVRLIVPQMYAYKSVKWLESIELVDKEPTGYWEERGYDKDAWVESQRL